MERIPDSAINIRYFLWRDRRVPGKEWAAELASILNCDLDRANELLRHGQLSQDELLTLSDFAGVTEGDFLNAPFLGDRVEVLQKNVEYLFKSEGRGGQKKFAESINVSPINVSRWRSAKTSVKTSISPKHLVQIKEHFSLPLNIDLTKHPIFLSLMPYGDQFRREWLKEKIQQVDRETLQMLFPAFEKLLGK
jgi:hypothetical protein